MCKRPNHSAFATGTVLYYNDKISMGLVTVDDQTCIPLFRGDFPMLAKGSRISFQLVKISDWRHEAVHLKMLYI